MGGYMGKHIPISEVNCPITLRGSITWVPRSPDSQLSTRNCGAQAQSEGTMNDVCINLLD
eukprot:1189946-Prorocentrum_minimum.AAC.3